ncbi:hypothetical protein [Helicobacter sp. MIT 99-5507]|uniref:hypothetical protein n=1 Tax=Helicobacter sp. MIT 99-5507 TaxID=152489 RepID=UPI000E1F4BF7|nr:hypothetical protein [Helicobacter sp. MIT 99-5507]RDU57569.1 hypothetical protein CQA42_06535 [Helicobacter sp. MIT 99-5507]
MPEIGRFYPLDAQELNIIYSIFGISVNIFYIFSSIFAFILVCCLFVALNNFLQNKIYSLFWIVILLFSPAFATAFLRLFVPEKLESVFFAIFIFSFIKFQNTNKFIFFILALISANLALYYKEVAFIMLGGFCFFYILFSYKQILYKQSNKNPIILSALLLISCGLWLIFYYIFVLAIKTNSGNYGDTPYNVIIVFLKNITNYALSEPFLFIGIFALLVFRFYFIVFKHCKINPILDSALIASFLHSLAYFALNIYSFHYPLPAYIFGIIPIAFYLREYFKYLFIKCIVVICAFIWLFNSFPAFIYQFNHYKAVPNNFANTIDFLASYISKNPHTNIYLDGVNRASSGEVYHSFIKNLEFKGIEDFDMKSDLPIDNALLGKEDSTSKYSVFKSNDILQKQSGDLVVWTPYSTIALDSSEYELLFYSDYGFNIPFFGIKSLLKSIIMNQSKDIILSNNISMLPIHFSVYRVK